MDSMLDWARRGWQRLRRSLPIRALIQAAGGNPLRAGNDPPQLCRWTTHATIVGLGVAAVVVGHSVGLPNQNGGTRAAAPPDVAEAMSAARQTSSRGSTGYLVRAAVPRTTVGDAASRSAPAEGQAADSAATPEPRRRSIETHRVQAGDTVVGLAQRFGITTETILAVNSSLAGNPDLLRLGQELLILPVSGVLHTVAAGETLSSIAQRYGIAVEAITGYEENNLSKPHTLHPGQQLVLPGATMPYRAPAYAAARGSIPANPDPAYQATGSFVWPTTGRLTQGSSWRHVAIDLGTPTGTPIYAADAGYVAETVWGRYGYGLYVLIDHGNGFRTRYAHMSTILARQGQWVTKGEKIGLVGSTGYSTGPHLHFEIIKNGVPQNPLNYLP